MMCMEHFMAKGSGGRTWGCRSCDMWFRYEEGELIAYAERARGEEHWYGHMSGWKKFPEGMLVTYGGDEE